MIKRHKKYIVSGMAMLVLATFGTTFIEVIHAGTVGIIYKANGGISSKALNQGWNFLIPYNVF
ncbi:hypothetical protein AN644_04980 [Candidatus Epulonipiscium fishelsonii]|nr:hypothetical protein AN644_04980 [Epulopiscium sp. SCG-C06WGA-EpuloA1]